MAKGSAQKTIPSKNHPPMPATGRKKLVSLPKPIAIPSDAHPLILAVLFEPGRALGLGQKIGTLERIDLRDREITETHAAPSKHRGYFSMWIRGPMLVVKYDGPKGKALVGVPIVGNVRRIEFDPA